MSVIYKIVQFLGTVWCVGDVAVLEVDVAVLEDSVVAFVISVPVVEVGVPVEEVGVVAVEEVGVVVLEFDFSAGFETEGELVLASNTTG